MRPRFLLRYFSRFHFFAAVLFLVPMAVGLLNEEYTVWPWLGPSIAFALVGTLLGRLAGRGLSAEDFNSVRRRESFLLVACTWLLMVVHGTIPFVLTGSIPDIPSAIFESASGFTTTGATVLADIAVQPPSILFWRSFTQWLGGMGIIVLYVAILPELAVGGMQLFSAESSGLGVEKLAPRIAQTAKRLWILYALLTLAEVLLLVLGDMSLFDAVNHAFTTMATGGFSPLNASIGEYALAGNPSSAYYELVITVFMFLAALNFALQYRVIVRGELRAFFRSSEVRLYVLIVVLATLLVTWNLMTVSRAEFGSSLRHSLFQVMSILSTTGFGTVDFDAWPALAKTILILLMIVGGCAGSTAGGLKVIRVVVALKHAARECRRLLYRRLVRPVTVDGRAIDDQILAGILGFFVLYVLTFVTTTALLCALSHAPAASSGTEPPASVSIDLVTASTAALSALNSIGPGLGRVGPVENYAFFHPLAKLALSFCMLLGRLEIYTLLILFLPSFWKRGR